MRGPRLTAVAQQAVAGALGHGDCAVDATLGNGHDTLFLARCVGPDGRVIGFDLQAQAIANTLHALREAGLEQRVELHHCSHQQLQRWVAPALHGRIGAVMFNLGYLPGGDKSVVTRADSTLDALQQALSMLRVGGLVSLLVYRGHAGAHAESTAVERWIGSLGDDFRVTRHESPGPVLLLIERLA